MVEHESERLDALFHALSHPTRRGMLRQLAEHECSVGELAEPYAMTFAGASKHVQVLERAGLVRRSVRGRIHLCRLEAGPIRDGAEWMRYYERFWTERIDRLEQLLREEDGS
ncbi:metalloregulator ArsR/SmtB family transcription factor [Nocardia sp. NPDC048505]|uniref:ArsR/SmtB family transcription factor n=1 Tax=unclassified Nocardia TaxID=2637762 RepID=UPI0034004D25